MAAFDLVGKSRCQLVGMVHLLPLPGSPRWGGDVGAIYDAARRDAERLVAGGCDALLVENMHDLPYLKGGVAPETAATMAVATSRLTDLGLPVGIQVLAAANLQALGVAVAAGASFVRAEGFAYAHVADEGWIDASAGPLLRRRADLRVTDAISVWADVKKKHAAHAVTGDLGLAETARGAVFCGADALIVTGTETGRPAALDDVRAAREAGVPVVVGSGVDAGNAAAFGAIADAVIVGTALKAGGDWRAPVDVARVRAIADAL